VIDSPAQAWCPNSPVSSGRTPRPDRHKICLRSILDDYEAKSGVRKGIKQLRWFIVFKDLSSRMRIECHQCCRHTNEHAPIAGPRPPCSNAILPGGLKAAEASRLGLPSGRIRAAQLTSPVCQVTRFASETADFVDAHGSVCGSTATVRQLRPLGVWPTGCPIPGLATR